MRINVTKLMAITPILVGAALISSVAWAHPKLKKSTPAQGSTLVEAPREVVLEFSEDVEPTLSKIEVKSVPGGKTVSEGKATYSGDAKNTLRIALSAGLENGKYVVAWKTTSVDTHKLKGELKFTLQGKP